MLSVEGRTGADCCGGAHTGLVRAGPSFYFLSFLFFFLRGKRGGFGLFLAKAEEATRTAFSTFWRSRRRFCGAAISKRPTSESFACVAVDWRRRFAWFWTFVKRFFDVVG